MFITIGTEFYYADRNTKTAEKCVAVMVRSGYPSTIFAKKESGETFTCYSDFGCFDNYEDAYKDAQTQEDRYIY